MDDKPKSEAKPRDFPKDGTFRVNKMAETGAPVIEGDHEVTMPGHLLARVGNFLEVKFDEDGVAHAVRVL
jgi:hypothetical protein